MQKRTFIIAEAGINHNGDINIAKKLIDFAADAKADAIKFQSFHTENVMTRTAPKAAYQKNTTCNDESQFEIIKRCELDEKAHWQLLRHCRSKGIMFLSSPFDLESIDLLIKLKVPIIKIPSGEITNLPYLRKVGKYNKRIIMSSGMATLREIKSALGILITVGTKRKNITILHCNTEYPSRMEDVNLRAMLTIKDKLKVDIGYSDHTLGIEVAIAAVALGASVIEKHFTLNRNMPGPDHKASLEPSDLKLMVKEIRNIEKALGSGIKKPSLTERKNIAIARKSMVAANNIQKGKIFTEANIAVKRPALGISPMRWDSVIGKRAKRFFKEDELIEL